MTYKIETLSQGSCRVPSQDIPPYLGTAEPQVLPDYSLGLPLNVQLIPPCTLLEGFQSPDIAGRPTIEQGDNIFRGIHYIGEAIALQSILDRSEFNYQSPIYQQLQQKLIEGARNHWASLFTQAIINNIPVTFQDIPEEIFIRDIKATAEAAIRNLKDVKTSLRELKIVIVAGGQGSGKDSLAPIFNELGYSSVSFSSPVRDVTSALLKDRNNTMDKIEVGKEMKSLFGDGILLRLVALNAIKSGINKMVVFGPRVMGEIIEAALLGQREEKNINWPNITEFNKEGFQSLTQTKIIGVRTDQNPDTDREIRRSRITARATSEPERYGDIANFDAREAVEQAKIDNMLSLPFTHSILNSSTLEDFYTSARQVLEHVL